MKKLLALLLASLLALLPACGLAETYRASLTLSIDQETVREPAAELLATLLPADASVNAEALIDACMDMMDGAGVEITLQENACRIDILLGGKHLLDLAFTVDLDAELVYMTSTLMPAYAWTEVLPLDGAVDAEDFTEVDDLLMKEILGTLRSFEYTADKTESRGAFTGDAYEGGTLCTTYTLDDADLASLVRGLLSGHVLAFLEGALGKEGVSALRERTNDMGTANAYHYVVRVVKDEVGTVIGVSVTVYRQQEQVATLSIGANDADAKLVLGLGLEAENYWYDLTGSWQHDGNVLRAEGRACEFLAERDETYAYAAATRTPVNEIDWHASLQEMPLAFDLQMTNGLLDVSLDVAEAAPLAFDLHGLTCVSMSDPADAEAYAASVEALGQMLVVRLIKVLPMNLLMNVNNLIELP